MPEEERFGEQVNDDVYELKAEAARKKSLKPAFSNKNITTEKQAIKALRPKKKSLPAKTIKIIISTAAAFVASVLIVTLCCVYLIKPVSDYQFAFKNVHEFKALSVDPRNKAISLPYDSPEENIFYLYDLANTKCKEAESLTVYNKGMIEIIVGENFNYMNVDAVVMKTQEEYFKCEHHVKDVFPLADVPIVGKIFMSKGGVTSFRIYCKNTDENARRQEVTNANYMDDDGMPYAEFDKAKETSVSKPVFNSEQEGNFTLTSHTVKLEYIKNCSLELYKDEETREEYYIMTFDLDVNSPEATAVSRQEIIAGTGDKNTKYTSITFGATIWKDGSFRTLTVTENWEADFKVTEGLFEMQYNWHFSYDESDCNLDEYPDAQGIAR